MQHLTTTNILLLFLGLLMNLLYAVQKQKKLKQQFLFGFYLKDNWITMVLNIIAAFASLIMVDDLANILHIQTDSGSSFYTIHAFISGVLPMVIIEKVIKIFKAKADE